MDEEGERDVTCTSNMKPLEGYTAHSLDRDDCECHANYVSGPSSSEALISERTHFALTLVSTDGDESSRDGFSAVDE